MSVTSFECVSLALIIQHAMCMSRITLSPVVFPARLHDIFPQIFHKRRDFPGEGGGVGGGGRELLEKKKYFDFLCRYCLKNVSF